MRQTTPERSARKIREKKGRRQDILVNAERLFSRQGFIKTGVAQIAEEAGFSINSLYQFFKSKEEIYISLVEQKMEEFSTLLKEAIAGAGSAQEKLDAVIGTKLGFFERNHDFFRIYVSEWNATEWTIKSALGDNVWKRYEEHLNLVTNILKEGVQTQEFRDVNPQEAAFALYGILNSTIYLWILKGDLSDSLSAKRNTLYTLFLDGVRKKLKRSHPHGKGSN